MHTLISIFWFQSGPENRNDDCNAKPKMTKLIKGSSMNIKKNGSWKGQNNDIPINLERKHRI